MKREKNLPDPKTCSEAAKRLREQTGVTYERERNLREIAFIIGSFGDTPVPQALLDHWDWSKIGDPLKIGEGPE